jgi:hypothetical protein
VFFVNEVSLSFELRIVISDGLWLLFPGGNYLLISDVNEN